MSTIADEEILNSGTIICPACQEEIPSVAKFCPECGANPHGAPPPLTTASVQVEKDPPCHACGKVIVGRTINAQGKKWHPDCFQCSQCAQPIAAESYVVLESKPWCEKCVEWDKREKERSKFEPKKEAQSVFPSPKKEAQSVPPSKVEPKTEAKSPNKFETRMDSGLSALKVEPKTENKSSSPPVVSNSSVFTSTVRRTSVGGSGKITCTGCFAPMSVDAPKCLGCGKLNARASVSAPIKTLTPTAASFPQKTQPLPSTGKPTVSSPPVLGSTVLSPPVLGPTPALTPTPPPSGRAFCPDCGANLPKDAKFCGECGMRF